MRPSALPPISILILLLILILPGGTAVATEARVPLLAPVQSWLAAQTNLQTWSAAFIQTRTLQSLTVPLTATGHVWFAAPERFRWELGHPPETIAICARTNLLLIYPRLKRVERIPLSGNQTGPWRDALAMLEAGFPRSEAALRERYQVLSQTITNQTCRVILEPRSAAARRMMPRMEIDFDTHDYSLRGTELKFSDGSTLRNDFYHVVLNPRLNEAMFSPPIPSDYTVVEPLARH
jgi:outer membrane lipoprotein-sorting protein